MAGGTRVQPADDNTTLAVKVIEDAMAAEGGSTHPALCHLYCHALELSPYPEKALPAADHLRKAMPDCGHLVHVRRPPPPPTPRCSPARSALASLPTASVLSPRPARPLTHSR
eukprot:COSAG01_NODE_1178_length_11365_cov_22.270613_12_plen_113_part_00